ASSASIAAGGVLPSRWCPSVADSMLAGKGEAGLAPSTNTLDFQHMIGQPTPMFLRGNRRLASSVALALLAFWPIPAGADEGRWLELSWQAPPECPPGAD